MCGLFGFSNYGNKPIKGLSAITNSLAEESTIRGKDATGIAYCSSGSISVLKESKPAYKLDFKHPENITALTGHTRHSTQGSEKKNYNNHPFIGRMGKSRFALAHNGVLYNDRELRRELRLPKTKIETDSYIAVQLIESRKSLNFDSIKYMAEKIEGSFSFSILDDENSIYLVKGDSPLSILHFPKRKLYAYASTDEILYRALIETPLFDDLKEGEFEQVHIRDGDIFKFCSTGKIEKGKFDYRTYYGRAWWDYGAYSSYEFGAEENRSYIDDLKSIASLHGYTPECIDELIGEGFTYDEIEEYLYGYYDYREEMLAM